MFHHLFNDAMLTYKFKQRLIRNVDRPLNKNENNRGFYLYIVLPTILFFFKLHTAAF
jgi:hypothetical protein